MSKKVRNLKILWTCQLCLVESENVRGVLIQTLSRSQSRKISMLMEWGGDDSGLLTSGISADYQAKLNLWRRLIKLQPGWSGWFSGRARLVNELLDKEPLQTIFLFTPCFYNLANIPPCSSIIIRGRPPEKDIFPKTTGQRTNQSDLFCWRGGEIIWDNCLVSPPP